MKTSSRFNLLSLIAAGLATILTLATAERVRATTFIVTTTANMGTGSLRDTIAVANDGDLITFNIPSPPSTITLTTDQLTINKNITITGPGADQLTVSGGNTFRIFNVTTTTTGTVSISGMTIANGLAPNSGNGGGINIDTGSTVIVTDSTISGAVSGDNSSGGGIYNGGTLTVTNSTIGGTATGGSTSGASGGAIYSAGTMNLTNCLLSGTVSGQGGRGGGIYNVNGILAVTSCTIHDSFLYGSYSSGGGIYNEGGALIITNSTIFDNGAIGSPFFTSGGGISNGGTLTVTNSTISGNGTLYYYGNGGGIYNYNGGTATVTDSTISGNFVGDYGNEFGSFGGGIYNGTGSTVTVTNSAIRGSRANRGGGLYSDGMLTVTDSTINDNHVTDNVPSGGGIHNGNGTLTVATSTINGNYADGPFVFPKGGGIYNDTGGTVTVTNSTISGNHVSDYGSAATGGGIQNSGTATVTNSTISGNYAAGTGTDPTGGGISNGGTINVKSSIIALNTADGLGPDVLGIFVSQGFNLVGIDENNGFIAATDLTGGLGSPLDPGLDPNGLQNNGGPTLTIALLFGSPAIDKGTSIGLTGNLSTDQRGTGFPRTFDDPATPNADDGTDIGAFELQTAPCPINCPSISGEVTYCPNPSLPPLEGVTLTLTGSAVDSTMSAVGTGCYEFLFPPLVFGGSYVVTPTKAALPPATGNIDTVDVLATQAQYMGPPYPQLSGCQLAAADVNGDTLVDTVDAMAIQAFFLGMSTGTANVGMYQFIPASRSYPGLITCQTNQNYSALILGDVAANFVYRPEGPSQTEASYGTSAGVVAAVALPEVAVAESKSNFIAAVTTSTIDAKNKLVGFQGDFTFDERVVTFQSEPVQKAGLTGGNWNVSGNVLPAPGPIRTLRISAYSNDFVSLSGFGTLFELRMTTVSKADQGTPLIWAAQPNHFIFIDADLKTQRPRNAAPGSVAPSEKRK